MEGFSYSRSQSPSYFRPLPLVMPLDNDSDMSMYLGGRLNQLAGYQDFDLFAESNIQAMMPTEPDYKLQPSELYPTFSPSPTTSNTSTPPISPTISGTDSDSPTESTGQKRSSRPETASAQAKRRMQNRQAQRRFRERKEERKQTLEQKAADIEQKYQQLSEQFQHKSEQLSQLLKDNGGLSGEVKDLRQRWRLMVQLLQRPNGPQSLAALLAADANSSSASCSSDSLSLSMSSDPAPLDEWLGCLQDLMSQRDDPEPIRDMAPIFALSVNIACYLHSVSLLPAATRRHYGPSG
ncbi:hypothetical protein BJX70DRAFT_396299 [Aspergillus crustosus]